MSTRPSTPIVTLGLATLCLAASYAVAFWPAGIQRMGFQPADPIGWTAFTSLFVHQNIFHLLGNLVFLAAVGPVVEAASPGRFLAIYLSGGLIGVLTHWAFAGANPDAPVLIGASGCIAAIVAYYNLRALHLQVHLAPKVGVPILVVTLMWILFQGIGAVYTPFGGGTAYWSHLGGFIAGLLLSLALRMPREADQQLGHAVIDRMDAVSAASKLAAADLHLENYRDDVRAMVRKAEALAAMDDLEGEAEVLVRLLTKLNEEDLVPVWARLVEIRLAHRVAALARLKQAGRFESKHPDLARRLLLTLVSQPDEPLRPDALIHLIPLCPAEEAELWKQELKHRYAMHPSTEIARARGLL